MFLGNKLGFPHGIDLTLHGHTANRSVIFDTGDPDWMQQKAGRVASIPFFTQQDMVLSGCLRFKTEHR
jgi:hypothetical protein